MQDEAHNSKSWDFPGKWLRLPLQETWVQPLVGEVRSHMLCVKKQNISNSKSFAVSTGKKKKKTHNLKVENSV